MMGVEVNSALNLSKAARQEGQRGHPFLEGHTEFWKF